jgi:hypothetical protein
MFGQLLFEPEPELPLWDGIVDEPVLGIVDVPEFVVVPEFVELELAAFAIAAPPPAMIPTAPSVTRAIRSRFMGVTSFRRRSPDRKDGAPKTGLSRN